LEGGGDLEEVMRWGSRTYWVDVRVFWAGRRRGARRLGRVGYLDLDEIRI
jgi:hypothetical protein